MSDSCVETAEAPAWLSQLERQREKLSKARLGHDSGAGAPCNSCGSKCPGLELHFWRKVCRACHCSKDVHDVTDDDLSGWAQFELLGTTRPNKATLPLIKIKGLSEKPVKVDWVPANASTELVAEYMSSLGELAPVAGSEGARRRRAALRHQLPPHDVAPEHAGAAERADHAEYLARLKSGAVGVGELVRVAALHTGNTFTVASAALRARRSQRALPLRVSRLATHLAYRAAPRPAPAPAAAPAAPPPGALSRPVEDKLRALRIEPESIRSAVEAGPAYDELLRGLAALRVEVDEDPALRAIAGFRREFLADPRFRAETTEYATRELGARPPPPDAAALAPGTVLAPGGELWSFTRADAAPPEAEPEPEPEDEAPPPPPPNYGTYPGRDEAGDAVGASAAGATLCRGCGLALAAGGVAVRAARGGGALWHPRCFRCARCDELLADLVYCWWRGAPYCARDLAAALHVPRCAGCDELIFARPYTAAEGRAFHVQHFCCYVCDAPLGGGMYVPDSRSGLPACLACYERWHAERCRACAGSIGAEQQGVSWGALHWHAACFVCAGRDCARSLLSGKFVVKQEMPFCSVPCVRTRVQ